MREWALEKQVTALVVIWAPTVTASLTTLRGIPSHMQFASHSREVFLTA